MHSLPVGQLRPSHLLRKSLAHAGVNNQTRSCEDLATLEEDYEEVGMDSGKDVGEGRLKVGEVQPTNKRRCQKNQKIV